MDDFKDLGGGKALRIAFNPGDSFGGRVGSNKDWKRFARFRFDAFNPSKETVALSLNVVHSRSTNLQTRVVMPIKLKPGKNEVSIGTDEMVNVNGSAPNLASVVRSLDALPPGGLVLVHDFMVDNAHEGPRFAAWYLLGSIFDNPNAVCLTPSYVEDVLRQIGFNVERTEIVLPGITMLTRATKVQ